MPDERIWERLAQMIGHPELASDERTSSGPKRSANRELVDPLIESWLKDLTRAEAANQLNAAGVPAGPVHRAEDVFDCPQVEARGMLMPIDDPKVGEYRLARTSPRLLATPDLPARSAPALGEHTRPILEGLLGYEASAVDALIADGVVQAGE